MAHSYGAMYAGYFTLRYPELVKAVVLVDPVPRDFYFSKAKMQKYQAGLREARKQPAANIYNKYMGSETEVIYQLLGFESTKESLKQLGQINNKIPVAVISSTAMEREKPLAEDWFFSQKQWLNNNPKSKILQVDASHFVQLDQPEVVCNLIKEIINH